LKIMERIMDEFVLDNEAELKAANRDRVLGLQVFIRRLIHLNQEKVRALVREIKASLSSDEEGDKDDLYQTLDKEKMAEKLNGRAFSRQVLSEIRSEINSREDPSRYESQSHVSTHYHERE